MSESPTSSRTAYELNREGFTVPPFTITDADCDALANEVAGFDRTGNRTLLAEHWCFSLGERIRHGLSRWLPQMQDLTPIQCTYFRKDVSRNWLVPWHQDRSLPVKSDLVRGADVSAREKDGEAFYQPTADVLERVVAVRVHLDASHVRNGPLRFLAGTHRAGVLTREQVRKAKVAAVECMPEIARGGLLVMKPLVLHASSKSTSRDARRVLQLVYA